MAAILLGPRTMSGPALKTLSRRGAPLGVLHELYPMFVHGTTVHRAAGCVSGAAPVSRRGLKLPSTSIYSCTQCMSGPLLPRSITAAWDQVLDFADGVELVRRALNGLDTRDARAAVGKGLLNLDQRPPVLTPAGDLDAAEAAALVWASEQMATLRGAVEEMRSRYRLWVDGPLVRDRDQLVLFTQIAIALDCRGVDGQSAGFAATAWPRLAAHPRSRWALTLGPTRKMRAPWQQRASEAGFMVDLGRTLPGDTAETWRTFDVLMNELLDPCDALTAARAITH